MKHALLSNESTVTGCVEKPQRGLPTQTVASTVWAAISDGHVPGKKYQTILEDHVLPMVQTLYPEGGAMYEEL